VELGAEQPVTAVDCRLGRGVALRGGYFAGSVFLAGSNLAAGAHVREGCLLEEESGGGQGVGLKQTILFPFATLGSLINFCDCLLAGGTSRRDHSEVGSSYIHFNYTPNQDKATASLLGDVPRGVMLREPPIFLGGQGGLVGPVRIGFGTVIAAGTVWRRDCPEGGKLLQGSREAEAERTFVPGLYGDIRRRTANNIIYLANLLALRQWYLHARGVLPGDPEMGGALLTGAVETIDAAVTERIARFRALAEKMDASAELAGRFLAPPDRGRVAAQQRQLRENWLSLEAALTARREESAGLAERDAFLARLLAIRAQEGGSYLETIRSLDPEARRLGTSWLAQAVAAVTEGALARVPACRA
jgi:UDP-N-acetylglucosamine/UDP-N-acetylgalactosamine diphosphorylase